MNLLSTDRGMSKKKVFLFSRRTDLAGKRLQRVVETFVPEMNLEILRDFNDLKFRLRQPGYPVDISILMAESQKDLSDLAELQDLLSDSRIIIVLPDRKKETIARGHRFRPRFITYADSDFIEIGAVLYRMLEDTHKFN